MPRALADFIRDLGAAGASKKVIALAVEHIQALEADLRAEGAGIAERLAAWRADGAARTRLSRAKKRAQLAPANPMANGADLPGNVTIRDGNVTSRDSNVTSRDSNNSPPLIAPPDKPPPDPLKLTPPLTPPPCDNPRARAAASAQHLPDDWQPAPFAADSQAAARAARMGDDWVADELETFRAHWAASGLPNARKRSWQNAWACWLKLAEGKRRPTHGRRQNDLGNLAQRPDPILAAYRDAIADVAAEQSAAENQGFDFGARLALPAAGTRGH
jgi:hypothetical protein